MAIDVKIIKFRNSAVFPKFNPKYGCYDIFACDSKDMSYFRGQKVYNIPGADECVIYTGLKFIIPEGYYGRLELVYNKQSCKFDNLSLITGLRRIDSEYRDELTVRIYNNSNFNSLLYSGDIIARLYIEKYTEVQTHLIDNNAKEKMLGIPVTE